MRTSKFNVEQQRFALLVVSAGWPVSDVCRSYGISRVTFYRWKQAQPDSEAPSIEVRALLAALTAHPLEPARVEAALAVLAEAGTRPLPPARVQRFAPERARAVAGEARCSAGLGVEAGDGQTAARLDDEAGDGRNSAQLNGVVGDTRIAVRRRDVGGDARISARLQELAELYPRWGYRRLRQILTQEGLDAGAKRTYRLYTAAGLAVRPERKKRRRTGRLGKALPVLGRGLVWELAVAEGQLVTGQAFVAWRVADAYTGSVLRVEVQRNWQRLAAHRVLAGLVVGKGLPLALHYGGDADVLEALEGWAVANDVLMRPLPDGGAGFKALVRGPRLTTREQVRISLEV